MRSVNRPNPLFIERCFFVAALLLGALLLGSCRTTENADVYAANNPDIAFYDPDMGLAFPQALKKLDFQAMRDFESDTPGLGYSVNYRSSAAKLEIYVYNLGANIVPNGIQGRSVRQAYDNAIEDIYQATQAGRYESYKLIESAPSSIGRQACWRARFALREDGQNKSSTLIVTGFNTRILKVRLTEDVRRLGKSTNRWAGDLERIGDIIQTAYEIGFKGVENAALLEIQRELRRVELGDGIRPDEARTIAQTELINQRLAAKWNVVKPEITSDSTAEVHSVRFPARASERIQAARGGAQARWLTVRIAADGSVEIVGS